MWRGFVGDEDFSAIVLSVGGLDLLFGVAALGIDFPGGGDGAKKFD